MGERLYECRSRNLYSRRELAERAGVGVHTVKAMELGEQAVTLEDAVKICKELDCSMEYLFTDKCGLAELIKINQKALSLSDVPVENLQKIAQVFWNTRPKAML